MYMLVKINKKKEVFNMSHSVALMRTISKEEANERNEDYNILDENIRNIIKQISEISNVEEIGRESCRERV